MSSAYGTAHLWHRRPLWHLRWVNGNGETQQLGDCCRGYLEEIARERKLTVVYGEPDYRRMEGQRV